MEDDVGDDFFLDTAGDVQADAQVAGEAAAQEADTEGFFLDAAGGEEAEVEDVVMEEGVLLEGDVYEEVVISEELIEEAPAGSDEFIEEVAAESVEIEAEPEAGGAAAELEAEVYEELVVIEEVEDDATAAPEEPGAEAAAQPAEEAGDEDFFTLDTTGEEAACEEAAAPEAPAATPDDGSEQPLLGDAVAASFAIDLEAEAPEAPEAPAAPEVPEAPAAPAPEEPAAKKPRLQDALFDLSQPISKDWTEEDSPVEEGLPETLEEMDALQLPGGSPSFTRPTAKWAGAPRPPAQTTARTFPKVMGPRGHAATAPVVPPKAKAGIPAWRPATGVVAPNGKAVMPKHPGGPPARGGAEVSTARLDPNSGFLFICTNSTFNDVANRRLFGSPGNLLQDMKKYIKPNTQLFLLNQDSLKLWGPFSASSEPQLNIDRAAFGGRFPAQVRALPTKDLMECQVERKIPGGYKSNTAMQLIRSMMGNGGPAPITVQQAWGLAPKFGNGPSSSPALQATPLNQVNGRNMIRPVAPRGGMVQARPPMVPAPKGGQLVRTDKFIAGVDKEGRQYNLTTVVVNFCNVGASYASKVLKKNNKVGDRLFDWEGVRRCVRCLSQELGLKVVGCIFENYWGPDNLSAQVPMPEDIRKMCASVQETPSITGKNHKSADDEMTIKCAYRRNCRFMDNDNYRDWLREMRDQRVRNWLENCQEMLQMRYFFDTDLGSFDTLDGNVPVGLLAEASKAKQMGMR